jgi:hypothetical protein
VKKITVYFDDQYLADNIWFQRSADCPHVHASPMMACCGGSFKRKLDDNGCWTGDVERVPAPPLLCKYRDPLLGEGDHIRGCHYEDITAGKMGTFGNVTVRHATPEEMAAARGE